MREGEAALRLVELHRGYADIHHDPVDPRHACFGQRADHLREAIRVQRQAICILVDHRGAIGDRIGVAVEGVDLRPLVEDRARIAARAEGRVDDHVARLGIERGDHLVEEDGDMRLAHLRFAFASASATSAWQAALAAAQSSPMRISSSGFQTVKNRPPPWK